MHPVTRLTECGRRLAHSGAVSIEEAQMNKSLLTGLIGGIGIATAGGVAGYALMSKPADMQTGSAAVEQIAEETAAPAVATVQPEPAAAA